MDNKYYTPEIEEFHVGFEYEIYTLNTKGKGHYWTKLNVPFRTDTLELLLEADFKPRVKYLDKEDIESLGFNTEDRGECYNKTIKWVEIGLYPWTSLTGIKHQFKIVMDGNQVFHGIIKNKSELKKLLKQLNILDG